MGRILGYLRFLCVVLYCIIYKVGNWHASPPLRRETAVTGLAFLAAPTASGWPEYRLQDIQGPFWYWPELTTRKGVGHPMFDGIYDTLELSPSHTNWGEMHPCWRYIKTTNVNCFGSQIGSCDKGSSLQLWPSMPRRWFILTGNVFSLPSSLWMPYIPLIFG